MLQILYTLYDGVNMWHVKMVLTGSSIYDNRGIIKGHIIKTVVVDYISFAKTFSG